MNCCVVGLQWGDEGKGKVVDILAENSDVVVRYSGGANAGHTVVIGEEKFALHIMPSGAVRKKTCCVIGNGVVVDPGILIDEIEGLDKRNISLDDRLFISENAHVVLDYHKAEDQHRENALGKNKIGTTIRGIGPCYADKIGRSFAVRMADFRNVDSLKEKLKKIVDYKNKVFAALYKAEPIDANNIFKQCVVFAEKLKPYITNTTKYLHESIDAGKSILFEGAQGALLDIDHGTFPFVTSSNASALGMSPGCGVPARLVDKFIGVVKAYSTRVGAGPFPSEQDNEIGQTIREKGNEYGTTTGRPRRCGWFDAIAVKYTVAIGGVNEIAMMHLDTLAGFDELKICKAYRINGTETTFFPSDAVELSSVECIYETMPGWHEDLSGVTSYDQLPQTTKNYIAAIENIVKIPVTMVGVGPKRSQAICKS
ncbi:MAG: adenylosuccinate synthase [Sedimentisphaerales bacterium]|nr:adenylosuccinate synthase [Sedimentisphaerales bacterium]